MFKSKIANHHYYPLPNINTSCCLFLAGNFTNKMAKHVFKKLYTLRSQNWTILPAASFKNFSFFFRRKILDWCVSNLNQTQVTEDDVVRLPIHPCIHPSIGAPCSLFISLSLSLCITGAFLTVWQAQLTLRKNIFLSSLLLLLHLPFRIVCADICFFC